MPSLKSRAAAVEWLVLDVDGVLTDGGIVYGAATDDTRCETKAFHVRDGSALKLWSRAGLRSAVITGRTSPLVEVRAMELDITRVYQGAADKTAPFADLLATAVVGPEAVCYVGDDVPDVPLLARVGLAAVPADACPEAKRVAHYVATAAGGRGAVREVVELILRARGAWA